MIKITFLGTSSAIPTIKRNHPAMLLTFNGENILVDCGEGTQRQFRKAKLNPLKITKLLITHWHGDHILGIPGLLQTLSFNNYRKKLYVYGPKGTKEFMKEILRVFVFQQTKSPIKVEEVSGKFFETKEFYLEAKPMTHGTPCNAYSFIKKGQIRIDKSKLKKYKIPSGPLLKRLKQGKDIIYKKKKYKAKDLTYKQDHVKISFVFDTTLNDKIVPFVKNSDLLIIESAFLNELRDLAKKHKHLTSKQAAEIAKKAKVKKLVLTHLSQRYEKDSKKILNEAKKIFRNTVLVNDLDVMKF